MGVLLSVVSQRCATSLHLLTTPLRNIFVVHTAESQYLVSSERAKGCVLTIGSHQIPSDLLVLDTPKYDVILGIDWPTRNFISINCAQQNVILSGEAFLLDTPLDT